MGCTPYSFIVDNAECNCASVVVRIDGGDGGGKGYAPLTGRGRDGVQGGAISSVAYQ